MDMLSYLIKYLLAEMRDGDNVVIPKNNEECFNLFRSLVNMRTPKPISKEFLSVQDKFLQEKIAEKGIVNYTDLSPVKPHIYLWQGDITTLKCDAIVNAANSAMLGCFYPCHGCIDNAIHTYSGVQLRLKCAEIMREQGHDEPTGKAKITPAYNLPCKNIIHTVGPYVDGKLKKEHCEQLSSCYLECLKAAVQNQISSIAFCCISTGEFHFPKEEAAKIAIETASGFLKSNPGIEVIFNAFGYEDLKIYERLLGAN